MNQSDQTNQTVVIVSSKYGFTRRYAKWIAEALCCPIFEEKNFNKVEFTKYDTIIYGGGLYAGGVSGIRLLTKNWDLIAGKKVILFTCGLADPKDPSTADHIRESLSKALPAEMLNSVSLFHLRGGIDYARLNLVHRVMMAMLRRSMLKKDARQFDEQERLLLDTYGKTIDFTDPGSIEPLIACAKEHR